MTLLLLREKADAICYLSPRLSYCSGRHVGLTLRYLPYLFNNPESGTIPRTQSRSKGKLQEFRIKDESTYTLLQYIDKLTTG